MGKVDHFVRAVRLFIVPLAMINFGSQLNTLQHASLMLGKVKEVKLMRSELTRTTVSMMSTKPNYKNDVSNIFWLHIQKTGTSFFNTIFYHFCSRARQSDEELPLADRKIIETFPPDKWCDANVSFYNFPRVGLHHPYQERNEDFWTFAMLRDPSERLRSAFAYNRHGIKAANKSSMTFDEYVQTPQIPNCQIKMILGYRCHQNVEPSRLNISKALERVEGPNFFFGLTDRWDESLCLFHHWFGGTIESYERHNNRKTKGSKVVSRETRSALQPPTDLDTMFVQTLDEIFEKRLRDSNCTSEGRGGADEELGLSNVI